MLTGVGPGRHGVVGNVYWDRHHGRRVVPERRRDVAQDLRALPRRRHDAVRGGARRAARRTDGERQRDDRARRRGPRPSRLVRAALSSRASSVDPGEAGSARVARLPHRRARAAARPAGLRPRHARAVRARTTTTRSTPRSTCSGSPRWWGCSRRPSPAERAGPGVVVAVHDRRRAPRRRPALGHRDRRPARLRRAPRRAARPPRVARAARRHRRPAHRRPRLRDRADASGASGGRRCTLRSTRSACRSATRAPASSTSAPTPTDPRSH